MRYVLRPFIIISVILVTRVYSASISPPQSQPPVVLVEYENENDGLGNSNFRYQLSDATFRDEKVTIKNPGTDKAYPVIEGTYEFTAPDGGRFWVLYEADEKGFRSTIRKLGDEQHIPSSAIATLQGGFG